jgi:hypothetical protein
MRTFLYSGANKSRDLARLAAAAASLRMPIYLASFGPPFEAHSLASYAENQFVDTVCVRLPGWGLPRTSLSLTQVAVQTNLAVLCAVIAGGDYSLVILDGIRTAVDRGLVDTTDLRRLARSAPNGVEIAMT